jgi:hypothetical protein
MSLSNGNIRNVTKWKNHPIVLIIT